MRDTVPGHEITPSELKALDLYFSQQRRHYAESLAQERAQRGPQNRRIGELSDRLRRYDMLHARTRAYSGRASASIPIDPRREDAAALHELKSFSQTLT